MANLKIRDLKKYLKDKNIDELQKEIIDIVKNFKDVKQYYNLKINPEAEYEILQKYKKIVNDEFLPDRGFGKMRYSVVNKAISDFEKISNLSQNVADLMLFYAEVGVEFTDIFGDIDERFYNNIEKAYENALEYICKNALQDQFKNRAKQVYYNATEGWGFQEGIGYLYNDYYNCDYDEE